MLLDRRDFLRSAFGAATISALPPIAAKAKEPKQTHPVPSFNGARADVFPGGTIKSLTVKETPSIPNMSTSLVEMNPGAFRGLHWHKTASEFGYVISGHCMLTVYDPNNHTESGPLNAGDIWFVPRGFAHSLWAAGNEGCTVCTVYDDGITTEQNALHVTDMLQSERPEIIGSSLGIPARTISSASADIPILALRHAIVTIFDGPGRMQTVELGPNDIGFLSRNQSHAVEAVGGKPFKLLSVFNASTFQAIGISELLAGLPNELISQNPGLSQEDVAKLPKDERFIVKNSSGA